VPDLLPARGNRPAVDLSQAAHQYVHEGRTMSWLSQHYGINPRTIKNHLIQAGVQLRPNGTRPNRRTREAMAAAYLDGASITHLAEKHGLSYYMVRSCIEEVGVQIRGQQEAAQLRWTPARAAAELRKQTRRAEREAAAARAAAEKAAKAASAGERARPRPAATPEQIATWVQAYQDGMSVQDIAARYGAGEHQVRDRLRAAGVLRTTRRPAGEHVAEWVRLHLRGWTAEDIARRHGHGFRVGTIRLYLRDAGLLSGRAARGRQGQPARLTAEDIAGMVAAYEAGEGGDVIGARYGVSKMTVLLHLRKKGVTIRSKREGTLLARRRESAGGGAAGVG